jgi:hypothetical protein
MTRDIWYCWQRDHEHSSEQEAKWCMELYDLWQEAMFHLMNIVREDEVAQAVNLALLEHGSADLEVE